MSKRHVTEIEAALNKGMGEGETHGCWLPRDAIAALPDFWELLPEGSYDAVTFDGSVPDELSEAHPIAEQHGYMYVFGHDGEQGFYFKLGMSLQVPHRFFSLAEAVGTFVAYEMGACMREPSRMFSDVQAEEYVPENAEFDLHKFEKHLDGLLSDLVYLCSYNRSTGMPIAQDFTGPVTLVTVRTAPGAAGWPDDKHEWQNCAQGFARLEA